MALWGLWGPGVSTLPVMPVSRRSNEAGRSGAGGANAGIGCCVCRSAATAMLQAWAWVGSPCSAQGRQASQGVHLLRCRSEKLAPAQRKEADLKKSVA